ncbi:MAG: DUF6285 domain-containing protein [Proteobacteria bacterium]|nr:DUF6285 domain-containing protein [Pseudomonadota bacterium]
MRDRPTGPELADLVRRIRENDPAVEVPDDARYRELMLASARAIAERQQQIGDAPEREELQSLSRILEAKGGLADLNRTLAAAIRGGKYDPDAPGHDAVRDHLWQTARDRVRESNPKALAGDE